MGGKGSGGKNRKPTAQKKAEGNRGKRKLNAREPKALPGEPLMPRRLTAEVQKVWPVICKMLYEAGVLYKTDAIAVSALCSSLVLFQQADRAIAKYGCLCATLDEITGVAVLRTNPAVRVRSDALRHLRSSWQAFGLDPSSRAGVQLPDPDPNSRSETALDQILRAKSSKDDIVH
jgi:P27 family predicted phage terminase small subunit